MIFSSVIFLFLFLPVFLALYFISPIKYRNVTLLLFSILFYSWGEKLIVFVMLGSTVLDFFAAQIIESGKKKIGLFISILANLGFLFFFKYSNFTFDNFNLLLDKLGLYSEALSNLPKIALPIGISFYTFQTLSYSIDVYRGNIKANRSFIDFATYVTMFPQLVAGPIIRYADIYTDLKERVTTSTDFAIGCERFIVGLAKKVLLANTFAYVADQIFGLPNYSLSSPIAWLGIICYSFQIYYDFSGYSDMAIGLGRILGFKFLENFQYPYISQSIKEFWRRWHISLSHWFRDYVYISLGGNRKGPFRTYLNLGIVFFVTGLWHGASWNFVVWGFIHGFFLIIERMGFDKVLEKLWKPVRHFYALFIAVNAWVFFRADDLPSAIDYFSAMYGLNGANQSLVSVSRYINVESLLMTIFAIIFASPLYLRLKSYLESRESSSIIFTSVFVVSLLFIFILSIIYVSASSYNPFIYFRF